jgi:hypothetical protein
MIDVLLFVMVLGALAPSRSRSISRRRSGGCGDGEGEQHPRRIRAEGRITMSASDDAIAREPAHKDWRRRYRLAKARWHYQMIRLDHDDAQALRTLAQHEGTTVAELIRTFVAWGLENYEARPTRVKK